MTRRFKFRPKLNSISAAFMAALFCISVPAYAEPVRITTPSGLDLMGEVLGYDGTYLRLDTPDFGILTLAYAGTICEGLRCPVVDGPAELRFAGSTRIGEVLLPALVEAFGRAKGWNVQATDQTTALQYLIGPVGAPVIKVDFILSDPQSAFAQQIEGKIDIVMSDRPASPDEVSQSIQAGFGTPTGSGRSRIIALDALVPVASPAQSVHTISLDDLAAVYRGDIVNWEQLGGKDIPIHPMLPDASSGQIRGFEDLLLSGSAKRADITRLPSTADLATTVTDDIGGLGVLPMGAFGNATPLVLQDVCGLRSVPRLTALKTGDYPLTLPLYLYLPGYRIAPEAREFVNWLQSHQAQAVIRRAGFVDQGAVPIGLDVQGERLANAIMLAGQSVPLSDLQDMLRRLDGHARLSPTFRFAEGSTALTPVSKSNLVYLAKAIRDGLYGGRQLALVGFSDGNGPAEANRTLSLTRADSVLAELRTLLGGEIPDDVVIETLGFGEALPMGCDETPWGRRMNRRVELWING